MNHDDVKSIEIDSHIFRQFVDLIENVNRINTFDAMLDFMLKDTEC